MTSDSKATERTRRRYDRLAPFYDTMELVVEKGRYRDWREALWSRVRGPNVLEVGVGTGKNMRHYPEGVDVTGIDIAPRMLARAHKRARELDIPVELEEADVQDLPYPDGTFDNVVATFVFCSVPDPIVGLNEARRVLKPEGQLLLLEHVRSPNPLLGELMELINPAVVRIMGANIDRETVDNVRRSAAQLHAVEELALGGIFKLIVAKKR